MDRVVRCPLNPDHLEIPKISIGLFLLDGIEKSSGVSLIDVSTGVEVSPSNVLTRCKAFARNLVLHGCRKDDVIALFAPNSIEWAIVLAAAFHINARPAGINSLLTAYELKHHLDVCRPKFIFTDKSQASVVMEVVKGNDYGSPQVIVKGGYDGCINYESFLSEIPVENGHTPVKNGHSSVENGHAPVGNGYSEITQTMDQFDKQEVNLEDACLIMFSSGTTGLQKAVLLSHRSLVFQCMMASHPLTHYVYEISIGFAPFSHIVGMVALLGALCKGYTTHIMDRFNFETYVQILSKNNISEVLIVPPIATLLAKSAMVDKYPLHLTGITCGAAILSPACEELLQERYKGLKIRQVFGMTETCALVAGNSTDRDAKPGSIGVPVFNTEMKVLDINTNEPLGPNEKGELCVKSPCNMIKYLNNEAATMETLDQEGYIHTGDFGYYDDDGHFFITDRIKELIKYNAYQVAPAELEAVLLSHPDVADAAVVGLSDPAAGELPMAWVVRQPSSIFSEEDLQHFVAGKVAPYKKLRGGIWFVEAIPKTSSGKILRKIIKSEMNERKLIQNGGKN